MIHCPRWGPGNITATVESCPRVGEEMSIDGRSPVVVERVCHILTHHLRSTLVVVGQEGSRSKASSIRPRTEEVSAAPPQASTSPKAASVRMNPEIRTRLQEIRADWPAEACERVLEEAHESPARREWNRQDFGKRAYEDVGYLVDLAESLVVQIAAIHAQGTDLEG